MIVTVEHNVETRHEPTPDGMVDVTAYIPSTTPWDYYGGLHQREMVKVLKAAGIVGEPLTTHRRTVRPIGTGPRGRVRFGDDMQPGTYRVAVKAEDKAAALVAIQAHKEAINRWLNEGGPLPDAFRS